jgi:hypothetical protein
MENRPLYVKKEKICYTIGLRLLTRGLYNNSAYKCLWLVGRLS